MPTTTVFSVTLLDVKNNRRPFSEHIPSRPGVHITPTRAVTYIPPQSPTTEFAVRVQNLRLEPISTAPTSHSSTVSVKNNLCFLIFIDGSLVYARMLSRVGEMREVDGQRVGEGKMEPFRFGSKSAEGKDQVGSVRVEVWNTEVIQKLGGLVPIWPKGTGKTGEDIQFARTEATGSTASTDQAIPSAAVICRRVGTQPLASFAIVYDPAFFNDSLIPLREAFLSAPSVFPNVILPPAVPIDPFDTPRVTSRAPPSYTPPSPPTENGFAHRSGAPTAEQLARTEDPKNLVWHLYHHIQALQRRLSDVEKAARIEERDVDMRDNFYSPSTSTSSASSSHNTATHASTTHANTTTTHANHININNATITVTPPPASPSRTPSPDHDYITIHSDHSRSSSHSPKRRREDRDDDRSECREKREKHRYHKKRKGDRLSSTSTSPSMSVRDASPCECPGCETPRRA
ncbi:hypothetical protein HDV00_005676 [Rhizophlyctis rosea]|nr:hypothetical protein HDV00_005676 [Rhizophlyctis rosea]